MAATDRAVRVGGVMPLSRPGFFEVGRHLKAGLELAVADVNGHGGAGGRSLELMVRDTGAGPARAAALVDELHADGVVAIAGEYHSVVAPAQSHCWRAYAETLIGAGYRRVALITQPDRYWSTGAGVLRAVLGEAGVGVVSVDASTTDAADAAAQLAETGGIAAAVLLAAYPEPAASLVKALRARGALRDIAIGDPAGRAEGPEWAQLLGGDGLGVSFLRYMPGRLGAEGQAIERRLTEILGRHPRLSPSRRTTRSASWSPRSGRAVASGRRSRRASVSFGELTVAGCAVPELGVSS